MGCFCEKLSNGGAVRHLEVVSGALGPLQSLAAARAMTIQIPAAGEGSKLDLTCAVSGCLAAGMNTGAAPVDGVLKEQVTRLRAGSRPGR